MSPAKSRGQGQRNDARPDLRAGVRAAINAPASGESSTDGKRRPSSESSIWVHQRGLGQRCVLPCLGAAFAGAFVCWELLGGDMRVPFKDRDARSALLRHGTVDDGAVATRAVEAARGASAASQQCHQSFPAKPGFP